VEDGKTALVVALQGTVLVGARIFEAVAIAALTALCAKLLDRAFDKDDEKPEEQEAIAS
jgi:hypothetical protein